MILMQIYNNIKKILINLYSEYINIKIFFNYIIN
jgi:hypothetical protein